MSQEKKIIIDEDWKSQVAAEKEAAEHAGPAGPAAGAAASPGEAGRGPAPEASFAMLVTMFVTEAMVALGQLPDPASGQLAFDADHARYAIDMLQVIAEKTRGNLAAHEERELREVVHQLRMAFVAIQTATPARTGDDSEGA